MSPLIWIKPADLAGFFFLRAFCRHRAAFVQLSSRIRATVAAQLSAHKKTGSLQSRFCVVLPMPVRVR
ncbi:hypothetical protein [Paraburkholderia sp.]|uniref:hypothetical protein n=1 Tax=Paraburkholderia sp. TaxID=1926495 RepID=UPI0025D4E7D4|nr:hypothetical protein [Paraburkholderia sp.]